MSYWQDLDIENKIINHFVIPILMLRQIHILYEGIVLCQTSRALRMAAKIQNPENQAA